VDLFQRDEVPGEPTPPGSDLPVAIFFALRPDVTAARQFLLHQTSFCDDLGLPKWKQLGADRFHVSVALPGHPRRLTEPAEIALTRSMERLCFPAFDLVFDKAVRFNAKGGEHALALEADEQTQEVAHRLRLALADVQMGRGIKASRAHHRMHLTLAYGANIPAEPVPIPPIGFRATEIVLIASPQGAHVHIPLGHWSLAEP
jgi:2'-5' RNA ligase